MSNLADAEVIAPRLIKAAREVAGLEPPQYGYYMPDERLARYLEIYGYRIGRGHNAAVDAIADAFFAMRDDPESRRLQEAFTATVEAIP